MTTPRRRVPIAAAAAIAALSVLAACSSGGATTSAGTASSSPVGSTTVTPVTGTVTVLAAASLTDAFRALAADFETTNPGATVRLSFGGSSALVRQLAEGAPADVFAAAATAPMDEVVAAGRAAAPVVFATNTMTVVVPADNPGAVARLADLADPSVSVALCRADVPCGAAAANLLARNGVVTTPVTEEPDVRSVLAKVSSGEVDAGIVYVTDVAAAGDTVRALEIPAAANVTTTYPAATVTDAANPAGAAAFLALLTSDAGRATLARFGFGPP